jgi:cobalt-precorrin 5A hydrolase
LPHIVETVKAKAPQTIHGKNMFDKGTIIIAVTHRGVETALKIQKALDQATINSTVYAPKKYSQNGVIPIEKKLVDFTREIYNKIDAIVAVMATGIIIRSIAPLIDGKLIDPAVVGVDAQGKFVISLLAGHMSGANDLTHIIAQGINAVPVITTASDSLGKQSVDEIANNLHLKIQNTYSLAALNSAIINGDRVAIILVGDAKIPSNAIGVYEVQTAQNGTEALELLSNFDAGIIITNQPLEITKFTKPFTILKTQTVAVGLEVSKEATIDSIIQSIDMTLEEVHVPLSRVNTFATSESQRNNQPLLDAIAKLGHQIKFLTDDKLLAVTYGELKPDTSEGAALIMAGPNARLIINKTKLNGVTIAIAQTE